MNHEKKEIYQLNRHQEAQIMRERLKEERTKSIGNMTYIKHKEAERLKKWSDLAERRKVASLSKIMEMNKKRAQYSKLQQRISKVKLSEMHREKIKEIKRNHIARIITEDKEKHKNYQKVKKLSNVERRLESKLEKMRVSHQSAIRQLEETQAVPTLRYKQFMKRTMGGCEIDHDRLNSTLRLERISEFYESGEDKWEEQGKEHINNINNIYNINTEGIMTTTHEQRRMNSTSYKGKLSNTDGCVLLPLVCWSPNERDMVYFKEPAGGEGAMGDLINISRERGESGTQGRGEWGTQAQGEGGNQGQGEWGDKYKYEGNYKSRNIVSSSSSGNKSETNYQDYLKYTKERVDSGGSGGITGITGITSGKQDSIDASIQHPDSEHKHLLRFLKSRRPPIPQPIHQPQSSINSTLHTNLPSSRLYTANI